MSEILWPLCNPNVALELGFVNALGRPYRIIAQGEAEEYMFDSLKKVQIHSYGPAPDYANFAKVIRKFTGIGSK